MIPVDDPEVQLALYEQIIQDGLSVRQVEEMVRSIANGQQTVKKKTEAKEAPSEEGALKSFRITTPGGRQHSGHRTRSWRDR